LKDTKEILVDAADAEKKLLILGLAWGHHRISCSKHIASSFAGFDSFSE
jgi:hypothetical protein